MYRINSVSNNCTLFMIFPQLKWKKTPKLIRWRNKLCVSLSKTTQNLFPKQWHGPIFFPRVWKLTFWTRNSSRKLKLWTNTERITSCKSKHDKTHRVADYFLLSHAVNRLCLVSSDSRVIRERFQKQNKKNHISQTRKHRLSRFLSLKVKSNPQKIK